MIVFDLQCLAGGNRFEAWFRSSADFDGQMAQGLVQCPVCDSSRVAKAPMAPLVPRRGGSASDARTVIEEIARVQAELLRDSCWVGERFADTARAMHLGEVETSPVHGQATAEQARSLVEDGVPIAQLPLPIVPPSQVN